MISCFFSVDLFIAGREVFGQYDAMTLIKLGNKAGVGRMWYDRGN